MTTRLLLVAWLGWAISLPGLGWGSGEPGPSGSLEVLDRDQAYAEITAGEGVTFVDLYAEW